jgi:hypothetical protein
MERRRWSGISHEVMIAVRRAVTDVLVLHEADALVEVTVRVQPTARLRRRTVDVDVDADLDSELDDESDQLKAAQEARFRGLELQ